jgi:hypothetical protein
VIWKAPQPRNGPLSRTEAPGRIGGAAARVW